MSAAHGSGSEGWLRAGDSNDQIRSKRESGGALGPKLGEGDIRPLPIAQPPWRDIDIGLPRKWLKKKTGSTLVKDLISKVLSFRHLDVPDRKVLGKWGHERLQFIARKLFVGTTLVATHCIVRSTRQIIVMFLHNIIVIENQEVFHENQSKHQRGRFGTICPVHPGCLSVSNFPSRGGQCASSRRADSNISSEAQTPFVFINCSFRTQKTAICLKVGGWWREGEGGGLYGE